MTLANPLAQPDSGPASPQAAAWLRLSQAHDEWNQAQHLLMLKLQAIRRQKPTAGSIRLVSNTLMRLRTILPVPDASHDQLLAKAAQCRALAERIPDPVSTNRPRQRSALGFGMTA